MKKIFLLFGIICIVSFSVNCFALQAEPVFSQSTVETEPTGPHLFDENTSLPFLDQAVNFLSGLYTYLRNSISTLLEKTLFKENPDLALFYGDTVTLLTSLTALYLILMMAGVTRKVIGGILLLGWGLLIFSIVLKTIS